MITHDHNMATAESQLEVPRPDERRPLDPSLYTLNDAEIAFFASQTGIEDRERLKEHILQVQADIYKVCKSV